MSFRLVFIAVTRLRIGLAAFLINRDRPSIETEQPNAEFVRTFD